MTTTVYRWEFVPNFLRDAREMIEEVHEPLYHYTDRGAAESMGEKGYLWLTRADCFLDESEIHYGIDIILAAVTELEGGLGQALHRTIDELLRSELRNAFVLSLTHKKGNRYLKKHYGKNVVKFEPTFQMTLNAGGFNIKHGLNMQVVFEIYRVLQGKVIYDQNTQHDLARRVAKAILDFHQTTFDSSLQRDSHSMRLSDLLLTAIVLMKAPSYAPEAEYRICLVRQPNNPNEPIYDQERSGRGNLEGRKIIYTEIFLPPANECISATYEQSLIAKCLGFLSGYFAWINGARRRTTRHDDAI